MASILFSLFSAGRLVPELEQQLIGISAGETCEIRFESGDDKVSIVTADVKDVQEKVLPPLDDELKIVVFQHADLTITS